MGKKHLTWIQPSKFIIPRRDVRIATSGIDVAAWDNLMAALTTGLCCIAVEHFEPKNLPYGSDIQRNISDELYR